VERQADEQADAEGNILKDSLQSAESQVESTNAKLSTEMWISSKQQVQRRNGSLFMC